MKKLTIISMAALLLLAASCKKEKKTELGGDAVFRATTETHSGDSKTQLVNKAVIWNSGDAIKVFNASGTPCEFTAVSEEGSSTTSFGGTAPDDFFGSSSYTAFYPSSEGVKLDEEGNYKITLPDTQTYAANSFGPRANPMAAVSTTTELPFKNICGLLKLQLYAEETNRYVKSITLKSNMSDEMLWGTGTVTFDGDGIPSLTDFSGGSTLTLDCGSVKLGTSGSPTVFYFVVPSGTLSGGFTVTVTDTDDKPILIKAAKANTNNKIQRSKITAMPAHSVAPISALPGVFSIDDGVQVFFSKGNLVATIDELATPIASKWRFAEHQYDCLKGGGANQTIGTAAGDVDLFGWSTDATLNNWGIHTKTSTDYTAGTFKDWGQVFDDKGTWFTLSEEQWEYLRERTVPGGPGGKSYEKISSPKGYIIYFDNYSGTPDSDGDGIADGCAFLPCAGMRNKDGEVTSSSENNCYYWSSSPEDDDEAYRCQNLGSPNYASRYNGSSVRLVRLCK